MTMTTDESIVTTTLPLAHPLEIADIIIGDTEMIAADAADREIGTIIDTVIMIVIEGDSRGAIRGTMIVIGEVEGRSEESKKEGGSSRSTGTKGVCTDGRMRITKQIRESLNNLLKDSLEETERRKGPTLKMVLILSKINQ